jgi:hypothetical protein
VQDSRHLEASQRFLHRDLVHIELCRKIGRRGKFVANLKDASADLIEQIFFNLHMESQRALEP